MSIPCKPILIRRTVSFVAVFSATIASVFPIKSALGQDL